MRWSSSPAIRAKWSSFAEAEKQSFGSSPLTATANSLSYRDRDSNLTDKSVHSMGKTFILK
jgi:hypothetical protein